MKTRCTLVGSLVFGLATGLIPATTVGDESHLSSPAHPVVVLEFTAPTAGHEAGFDSWIADTYLTHLRAMHGTVPAQTFALRTDISPQPKLPPYLTVLEIPGPGAGGGGRADAWLKPSTYAFGGALDASLSVIAAFEAHGPRVLAVNVHGATALERRPGETPKKYALVVLSNPTAGREAEYNKWYDTRHLQDVLRVPGFISGQRYKLFLNETPQVFAPPRYLVIFSFESYDVNATRADIKHRLDAGITGGSDAFDMKSSITRYYERLPAAGSR
jgi:hypothetical protein